MSLDVHYPDISEALHSASSLDEAWIGYIDMLRDTDTILFISPNCIIVELFPQKF